VIGQGIGEGRDLSLPPAHSLAAAAAALQQEIADLPFKAWESLLPMSSFNAVKGCGYLIDP